MKIKNIDYYILIKIVEMEYIKFINNITVLILLIGLINCSIANNLKEINNNDEKIIQRRYQNFNVNISQCFDIYIFDICVSGNTDPPNFKTNVKVLGHTIAAVDITPGDPVCFNSDLIAASGKICLQISGNCFNVYGNYKAISESGSFNTNLFCWN